eukprot:NODE_1022_length_2647_cov_11.688889.p1 GENE.NODE_1022_length_2647_cov_11.688889~~NODE_1022_length_2647_cov_11.688889.p1  ORF type:complete len:749 (-),score=188.80 NODE_1022_length_2647_cov_11.688889:244-2490(-)
MPRNITRHHVVSALGGMQDSFHELLARLVQEHDRQMQSLVDVNASLLGEVRLLTQRLAQHEEPDGFFLCSPIIEARGATTTIAVPSVELLDDHSAAEDREMDPVAMVPQDDETPRVRACIYSQQSGETEAVSSTITETCKGSRRSHAYTETRRRLAANQKVDSSKAVKINLIERKLRAVLDFVDGKSCINASHLGDLMWKCAGQKLDPEECDEIIRELENIRALATGIHVPLVAVEHVPSLELGEFVELLMWPTLANFARFELQGVIGNLQSNILTQAPEEVILKVANNLHGMSEQSFNIAVENYSMEATAENRLIALNLFVSFVIALSLFTLGLSMDVWPTWSGWIAVECAFAIVFVTEFFVKQFLLGYQRYWCGPDRAWNWLDFSITVAAFADAAAGLVTSTSSTRGVNFTMALRCFRVLRVVRLVRLLRSPYLKDFTQMLLGLLIGLPWLFWVLCMLGLITYLMGMGFRQLLGPEADGPDLYELCGDADLIGVEASPCDEVHRIFGAEYFATVPQSMFTVFRCMMIGDCSSKRGQSLAMWLSSGYGWKFYLPYAASQIVIIFAVFNVITALFLEATMSGLKYNDMQRNFEHKYECRYVKRKLEALVHRVRLIRGERAESPMREHDFNEVVKDPYVVDLLEQLDVSLNARMQLFDVFDADGDGSVTVGEFMDTLLRIRGEPQKSDVVATWVTMRDLRTKFEDFQRMAILNQQHILGLLASGDDDATKGMPSEATAAADEPVNGCDV